MRRCSRGLRSERYYDGPVHEAVAADEIEFLHRHLLGRKLLGAPKASTVQTRAHLTAKAA